MKNLIFVNDAFFGGGAEKSMRILLNNIQIKRNFKYQLIILESKNKKKIINWCEKRNINVLFIGDTKNIIFFKVMQIIFVPFFMAWKLRKSKGISILSFQNRSNYMSIIFKIIFSLEKLIISERNYSSIFFSKGIKGFLNRKLIENLYPFSDKIVTNSEESKFDLIYNFNIDKRKLIHINNGYDFDEIITKADQQIDKDFQRLVQYNTRKDIFVTVARLEYQKGYRRLIDAISIYKTFSINEFIWLIIGEGSLRDELENYCRVKSLESNICFLGFKDNPLPFTKSANLFLFGSYFEGFPNSLAEAVILNTPIITFSFKSGLYEVTKGYPNLSIINSNSSYDFAIEIKNRLKQNKKSFIPTYNLNNLIKEYNEILFND